MTGLFAVIRGAQGHLRHKLLCAAGLVCALLFASAPTWAQSLELELQALTNERNVLTAELDQYKNTVKVLQPDGSPPEQSSNPAVRKTRAGNGQDQGTTDRCDRAGSHPPAGTNYRRTIVGHDQAAR